MSPATPAATRKRQNLRSSKRPGVSRAEPAEASQKLTFLPCPERGNSADPRRTYRDRVVQLCRLVPICPSGWQASGKKVRYGGDSPMRRQLRPRAALGSASARLVLLSLIAGTLAATALTSSAAAAPIYINTGGGAVTDVDGHKWIADAYYAGGSVGSTATSISGTKYQNIFKNERFGMTAYHIPVTNGTYTVKLLESEHYFNASNKRVFNVKSEGVQTLTNLDIYAKAGGKNKSLYSVFKSTVTDGKLDLAFIAVKDKPKVDGIVLEPITTTTTTTGSV